MRTDRSRRWVGSLPVAAPTCNRRRHRDGIALRIRAPIGGSVILR